jgi:hypothetical protein
VVGAGGDPHQLLEHMRDILAADPVIAAAPLLLFGQQAARNQLGEMRARRLRRDPGFLGKLGRGESPAVHQRAEHVRAGRNPDQRRHKGYVRTFLHSSIITEA